jgi:hypothetical protein
VYSSHFLEHVPKSMVTGLLRECWRVLAPGRHIRLALPDLENMTREYLLRREAGDHDKADFVVLEIVDQCVRWEPGGELGRFYEQIRDKTGGQATTMMDYVRERVGEDLRAKSGTGIVRRKYRHLPAVLRGRMERMWVQLCLLALPAAFRAQNVSRAGIGERHHWLWDFHQLRAALESAGFVDVLRRDANSSAIAGFPFQPLDLDDAGRPRKGTESMYVEARKP